MRQYIITIGKVQRVYEDLRLAIETFEWARSMIDGELINCCKGQIEIFLEYQTEAGNICISFIREDTDEHN